MQDFLLFFDEVSERHRQLRLSIGYSKICDWCIRIEHSGQGDKSSDVTVCDIQDCDMVLAFAMAHVALKNYLSEKFGGY